MDHSMEFEKRAKEIVSALTLDEKIACLTVNAPKIDRTGMDAFSIGGEIAHGIEARHDQEFNKGDTVMTTVFPQPIGMSATWDEKLIEAAGEVAGTEARAIYNKYKGGGLSCFGPTVDMERDPRWGRTEEGYGEDPFLTGKMASAYIRGIQGEEKGYLRCSVTLKHFYGNNEEKDREKSSSSIDRRNKEEYYLEPFRRAIVEGGAESVMTSYNEINGIPAIVNPEIKLRLKEQWGMKGHVVCDMGDMGQNVTEHHDTKSDAETVAKALNAGVDVFNDPDETVIAAAESALKQGMITETEIDNAVIRSLYTRLRLGINLDSSDCSYRTIDTTCINCDKHKEISLKMAMESIVLLKNEEKILPLEKGSTGQIAVVGPLAAAWNKDWYSGIPKESVTPIAGMQKEFGKSKVEFADGLDRVMLRCNGRFLSVGKHGRCCLSNEGEPFIHTDWGDNRHTFCSVNYGGYLYVDLKTMGLNVGKEEVFSWMMEEVFSMSGEEAGKLSSIPAGTIGKDTQSFFGCGQEFGEEISFHMEIVADGTEQAKDLARISNTVVAVMGCHPIVNCKEGLDRLSYCLPPAQEELLRALYSVNPKVILVLITNYPYRISWIKEKIPVILTCSTGSQDMGIAIAKTLSGENSPAGRLPMTWYADLNQISSMQEYDIIRGKRTYQYFGGTPAYPFGHGLSYTEFAYKEMKVESMVNRVHISVLVWNTGEYDGDDVVQLYIRQKGSRAERPNRQLKGFKRIFLEKGEKKKVTFQVPYEELKYYDVVTDAMLLEQGEYIFLVGSSSADIRCEMSLVLPGTVIPPRNGGERIFADQYDNYSNMVLHRGHDGACCMMPKENKSPAVAIYWNTYLLRSYTTFVADLKAEEDGRIAIYFGEALLGSLDVGKSRYFCEATIPIESHEGEGTLRILLMGKIRLVSFTFC